MQIEIIKGTNHDTLRVTRADGSIDEAQVVKKGPVPHDGVHFAVESGLKFGNAFFGLIAAGRHPDDIAGLASAMGHSSAKKARVPDPSIVELIQAERLVECFEAEVWGGPADLETLQSVVDAAFSASLVPRVVLTSDGLAAVRARIDQLKADWLPLKTGSSLRYDWP
jgi:hypothetical protein